MYCLMMPTALSSGRPAPTGPGRIHVVRAGETLRSIAKANKIAPQELADFNAMRVYDPLLPGQSLRIPTPQGTPHDGFLTHRVQKGDSLATIARRYNVSVEEIRRLNPVAVGGLRHGDLIRIARSAI